MAKQPSEGHIACKGLRQDLNSGLKLRMASCLTITLDTPPPTHTHLCTRLFSQLKADGRFSITWSQRDSDFSVKKETGYPARSPGDSRPGRKQVPPLTPPPKAETTSDSHGALV